MSIAAPRFHALTVAEIRREAPDAVAIRFDLPDGLRAAYAYQAGQYLTLRREFGGEELRRCYSLCRNPDAGELWVGVREEAGGRFSGWLNREARPGDCIEVMNPEGRFTLPAIGDASARNILCVAAGSGITPVLAILEAMLADEPESTATLVYANRDTAHIMFRDAVQDLKDRYLSRFRVFHILTREPSDVELLSGRIDAAKCAALFGESGAIPAQSHDLAFLCGPEEMMDTVAASLAANGLDPAAIRRELFLNADSPQPSDTHRPPPAPTPDGAQVTIILDQRQRTFVFDPAQESILDAARAQGADVPYACKAGVCATCRAHLSEGEVTMARNQALDADEVARGYILTCQSRPKTAKVVVDYDRRSG